MHKACMHLQSEIKWALTATPVMNKMTDFVYILDFIGISQHLCQNYKDEISEMYILRRTKEDVETNENLPELNVTIEELEFSSQKEKDLYLDTYNEISEIMKTMQEYDNKNTIQALELLLRIRQVCTYPQCYFDGIAKKTKEDAYQCKDSFTKVEHIIGKIESTPSDDKALIFCHFTKELDAYIKALELIGFKSLKIDGSMSIEERAHNVSKFSKDDKYKAMVIQIQTGAVGLNLQCANHVFITSPLWSPALQHQVIGRAHRNGQKKDVNVHIYAMKSANTNEVYIEQYILRLQQRKREMISEVLNDNRIKDEAAEFMEKTNIAKDITFADVFKMFQHNLKR